MLFRAFCGVGGIIYRLRFFYALKTQKNAPASQRRTFYNHYEPNLKPIQNYNNFLIYANKSA